MLRKYFLARMHRRRIFLRFEASSLDLHSYAHMFDWTSDNSCQSSSYATAEKVLIQMKGVNIVFTRSLIPWLKFTFESFVWSEWNGGRKGYPCERTRSSFVKGRNPFCSENAFCYLERCLGTNGKLHPNFYYIERLSCKDDENTTNCACNKVVECLLDIKVFSQCETLWHFE